MPADTTTCPVCGAARCVGHTPPTIGAEARGWAIAAHLSGLGVGLLTAAALGFLGPLTIWLLRRDDPYAEHHAKEALNFQLTVLLVLIGSVLLVIPLVIFSVLTLGLGLIVAAVAALAAIVAWFVLPIVGAVRASSNQGYRYPVTIRFIS